VLPGGRDLKCRLVESLSDRARRFEEKQKTKLPAAIESTLTNRVALVTAAVEKHPENETFRDMLQVPMEDPAGQSASTLSMCSLLSLHTFSLYSPFSR